MIDRARSPRIWAVVPFRGPVGSKRRLAGLLDPAERERLSLVMLADVLDALLGVDRVERVLLLTASHEGGPWPEDERLTIVEEVSGTNGAGEDGSGLNAAVRQAQQVARSAGAEGLLILPADLPLLARADLEAILDAAASAQVVIAPDRAAEGTNALLLAPPDALAPSFGVRSYASHRHAAELAGLSVAIVERRALGLDLDTAEDVAALLDGPHGGRAARLLRELRVDRRLERLAPSQARSTTI
jgi:2-phospho-L-lactate/phosphoenolpyruvate guanylyltransferase